MHAPEATSSAVEVPAIPNEGRGALATCGRALFRLRGWTFEPLPANWEPKQIIVGFPHTAWIDTAMAFGGFAMVGQHGHVMVKQEAFRWPFAGMMRKLGAIPVDRATSTGIVEQMAREFATRDEFQLALVPEGTRQSGAKVRTGFWHIAKAAKVPIMCWYLDRENRRTRWAGRIVPGDDLAADLREIKRLYAAAGHVIEGIAD